MFLRVSSFFVCELVLIMILTLNLFDLIFFCADISRNPDFQILF